MVASRRIKWAVVVLAYGVHFLLPWLRWERVRCQPGCSVRLGGAEVLFDLVVHPQDIFWLAGLLMIAAYLLFFVTGWRARVLWLFLFSDLWTDVYILIERTCCG